MAAAWHDINQWRKSGGGKRKPAKAAKRNISIGESAAWLMAAA